MPLYSDANYYYSGGSSQLFAPYYPTGVYSIPTVSSAYAPYTSSYSRTVGGSYSPTLPKTPRSPTYSTLGLSSRYQPKLSTIGETSTLMTSGRHSALLPLTRTHSPKIKSYSTASSTTLHSKYIPPRPININTADIDVSSARHRRHTDEVVEKIPETETTTNSKSQTDSLENEVAPAATNAEKTNESNEPQHMRSTIRRNRPVVRLSTVRVRNKDARLAQLQEKTEEKMQQMLLNRDQTDATEEKVGWRQKLAEDLALLTPNQTKKSPGQRLKERFLIQDKTSTENEFENKREATKENQELMDEVLVQVDPVNHICHVSVPSGPTFHDICADISSDKIDDDLNAGALRKRASIIMEQETQLLNQLQQSASGTFQLIHLERRASHDSSVEEPLELKRTSKRLSKDKKKIKHKITAIVDVQNAPLTPILQEGDEEVLSPALKVSPKPKISYNVDHVDEHHQIHKVFKLPKKKSVKRTLMPKTDTLPAGFLEPLPKAKRASKSSKTKKSSSQAKVFTFSQASIDKQNAEVEHEISLQQEKEKCAISNESDLKTSQSLGVLHKTKNVSSFQNSKSLDSAVSDKSEEVKTEPAVATPKPIRKVLKSDSSEDFWSYIGTRETVYMANRKNVLQEMTKPKVETMTEPSKVSDTLVKHNLQMNKQQMAHTMEKIEETNLPKVSTMKEPLKISKPIEQHNLPDQMKQNSHKKELATKTNLPKVEQLVEASSIVTQTKVKTAQSLKEETGESSLKVIETTSAKSEEADKKSNAVCIIDKIATSPSATTTSTSDKIIPKIQTGNVAKSPEIQLQKTIATTTTTTTTATAILNENSKNINLATTKPKTSTNMTTTTTTIGGGKNALNNQATTFTMQTATTKTTMATKECVAEVENKTLQSLTNTTKTTANNEKERKDSPLKSNAINKAKTSPINADGFITVAPLKATNISPTNAKNKNASPKKTSATATTTTNTKTLENATKLTDKVTMTTTLTTTTTTTKEKSLSTIAKTVAASNQTETTTTAMATTTTATTTTTTTSAITTIIATEATTSKSDKSDGGNNLSKFATVLDLAQCLRDVDADLEDYIPSSAENSNDEDNLSDDSTFYCSSVDGCENLSASMKKKLKQKKLKEKKAQEARFDPQKKIKIDTHNKCYVKEEAPRFPLVATPRPLWKREKIVYNDESSEDSDSDEESGSTEETEDSEECTSTSEEEYDNSPSSAGATTGSSLASTDNSSIIRMSTCSNDSGFEGGTAPSSPKKMLGARETRDSPSTPPSLNPAYKIEAEHDETSYTYTQFQKSGRFAPPATVIPRFKNYCVDDFHFLAVLGKGSFGKVLLAELRDTTYYYAVKCLKKDVVLEDDDVDSTLIERKVLALGTKHPYLCHLFCTFQTESHLFFVMEYLNGGDLMFHIQESGRFPEERARFYGAEIISGLKFLHKKGIIYRDLKLDNVLLDFEGHVRIADFGMCKLQIYLDKTADSFCGTPDYMAPEIIKGEKYNQNVDWWSFGVLLYEMLIGQSPFSGCDEDELFWSICNEIPWFPVYISGEATSILKGLLEKDYTKRIGSQYSPAGEVSDHIFFHPIDWNLLEKKQLEPPFKPQVKHPLDTQYFDRVFTRERVRLTPVDKEILQSIDQKQFMGFTYTNPHIALD